MKDVTPAEKNGEDIKNFWMEDLGMRETDIIVSKDADCN